MNKLFSYILTFILIINSIFWLMLSKYGLFNFCLVSFLILINSFLIRKLHGQKISQGFKIGLYSYILLTFSISIITALISPSSFKDNYFLIFIISLLFSEFTFYGIVNYYKNI